MATWQKYALFQVPGWLAAAVILLALMEWISLSPWAASGLFSLWVIKDIAMYPLLRTAYQSRVKTGVEQLVGEKGVVQSPLGPRGMVRVRGELWQAETESSELRIERNSKINVKAARGLTLIVSKEPTKRGEGTITEAMAQCSDS